MRLPTLTLVGILAFPVFAQTNLPPIDNFTLVTNLWYNGHKSNVLAIAEERLAINSNDLAGLIVRFNYDLEFSNRVCYSNDIVHILDVLHTSQFPSLTNNVLHTSATLLQDALVDFLDYMAGPQSKLSPEEEIMDRQKRLINQKPLADEAFLKTLADNGLF